MQRVSGYLRRSVARVGPWALWSSALAAGCGETSASPADAENDAGGSGGATSSGGTAGGGGSSSEGAGGVQTLGADCSVPGALACAGTYQKLALVCAGDGAWGIRETCGVEQFCDSSEGPNRGLCRDGLAECMDEGPGTLFCNGTSVEQCGPDAVTSEVVQECEGGCVGGACNDSVACPTAPNVVDCAGDCPGEPCECKGSVFGRIAHAVRIPDSAQACEFACDSAVRGITVEVSAEPNDQIQRWRVMAPAPWSVAVADQDSGPCSLEPGQTCATLEVTVEQVQAFIYVFTDEPDVKGGNVSVEPIEADESCPEPS